MFNKSVQVKWNSDDEGFICEAHSAKSHVYDFISAGILLFVVRTVAMKII